MKKILILAANPRKDLNLNQEIRDLKRVIERSENREKFEVIPELAVQVESLQDLLLKYQPQIVHFCGHGSGDQGLVFESERGGEHWVGTEALANLFQLFDQTIECVLLNACYSEKQANAIIDHVNYVIGMNQEIQDDTAIAFSKGFYRALGYDYSIERAYKFGCNAIHLEISGSSRIRSGDNGLERKFIFDNTTEYAVIPEHLKPIFKTKLFHAQSHLFKPSEEVKTKASMKIDHSLEEENNQNLKIKSPEVSAKKAQDKYRQEVKQCIINGEITFVGRKILDTLTIRLGLSQLEAKKIEDNLLEVAQQEFQKNLQRYEHTFIEVQNQPEAEEIVNVCDSAFLTRCQQELTYCIGPIASFILKDKLNKNPNISPQTLVNMLLAEIPNPQEAERFKQRLS